MPSRTLVIMGFFCRQTIVQCFKPNVFFDLDNTPIEQLISFVTAHNCVITRKSGASRTPEVYRLPVLHQKQLQNDDTAIQIKLPVAP